MDLPESLSSGLDTPCSKAGMRFSSLGISVVKVARIWETRARALALSSMALPARLDPDVGPPRMPARMCIPAAPQTGEAIPVAAGILTVAVVETRIRVAGMVAADPLVVVAVASTVVGVHLPLVAVADSTVVEEVRQPRVVVVALAVVAAVARMVEAEERQPRAVVLTSKPSASCARIDRKGKKGCFDCRSSLFLAQFAPKACQLFNG